MTKQDEKGPSRTKERTTANAPERTNRTGAFLYANHAGQRPNESAPPLCFHSYFYPHFFVILPFFLPTVFLYLASPSNQFSAFLIDNLVSQREKGKGLTQRQRQSTNCKGELLTLFSILANLICYIRLIPPPALKTSRHSHPD